MPELQEPNDESRIIAAICYILGFIVAALVLLLKKDDRYTKFHAVQAILFDIVLMVLMGFAFVLGFVAMFGFGFLGMFMDTPFGPGIGFLSFWVIWLIMMVVTIGVFALNIFLAWKAFRGKRFKLPFIGKHAEKIALG